MLLLVLSGTSRYYVVLRGTRWCYYMLLRGTTSIASTTGIITSKETPRDAASSRRRSPQSTAEEHEPEPAVSSGPEGSTTPWRRSSGYAVISGGSSGTGPWERERQRRRVITKAL